MFAEAIDKYKQMCYTKIAPPQKGKYEGIQGVLSAVHQGMAGCSRRTRSEDRVRLCEAAASQMKETAERDQLSAVFVCYSLSVSITESVVSGSDVDSTISAVVDCSESLSMRSLRDSTHPLHHAAITAPIIMPKNT